MTTPAAAVRSRHEEARAAFSLLMAFSGKAQFAELETA